MKYIYALPVLLMMAACSNGAIFGDDDSSIKTIEELNKYFNDFERVATLPKNDNTIMFNSWSPKEKCLLMFGSEADGLSEELIKYSTQGVTIEMNKQVESLNLSVSASIFMHKLGF